MLDSNHETLLRVTWYYYMENYTQQRISELMGISRAKVIRLLEEGRQRGVIQFAFRKGDESRMMVERQLIDSFGLEDVHVVPSPETEQDIGKVVARAAAVYVNDRIESNGFINIGYGETIGHLLSNLVNDGRKDVNVVSLTGGVNYYLPRVQGGIYGLHLNLISAPLMVSRPELRDELINERSIRSVYQMIDYADMSVVGIGGMDENATVLSNGILTKDEQTILAMKGAVGDILNHFYDKDGNPVESSIEDRLISTSLDKLAKLKKVIGVAGGRRKVEAIYAVLRRGYLNVLITDEGTANNLLARSRQDG